MARKGSKTTLPARKKHPLLHDKEWLYQKLIEEQRTYQEVADMIGCTHQRVHQKIRELGWEHLRRKKNPMQPKQRRILETLKTRRNLTRAEIAEQCNVTPGQVRHVVEKYGIRPGIRYRFRYPLLRDREWLYQKLIKEQLTYSKVAEMIGCCTMSVYDRTRELGWLEKRPRYGRTEPPDEEEKK